MAPERERGEGLSVRKQLISVQTFAQRNLSCLGGLGIPKKLADPEKILQHRDPLRRQNLGMSEDFQESLRPCRRVDQDSNLP